MRYVGEWLTLAQAAHALGLSVPELKPLSDAGDIDVVQLRPTAWRVRTSTVDDLLANPTWRKEHGK